MHRIVLIDYLSMLKQYLTIGIISAIFSWSILLILETRLKRILLDIPNNRSSHSTPKATSGGISFVLVAVVVSIFSINDVSRDIHSLIPIICLPLAFIGLVDDLIEIKPFYRYSIQLITSIYLVVASLNNYLDFYNFRDICLTILIIISSTAVINFTNFMDGVDGLIAGTMLPILITSAYMLNSPNSIWALIGGLIGFIPWNWNPSKFFMGDIGSTFLGALFIGILLQGENLLQSICLLLIATPILADACSCVLRRFFSGRNIFKPHRSHLYQRLQQSGFSHAKVSSIYILGTIILSITYCLGGPNYLILMVVSEIALGYWLDQNIAVKFLKTS